MLLLAQLFHLSLSLAVFPGSFRMVVLASEKSPSVDHFGFPAGYSDQAGQPPLAAAADRLPFRNLENGELPGQRSLSGRTVLLESAPDRRQ